ncbi:FGGY carbohydrate kinase domain-containing protein [Selaginella moellendorffii]|uniref:FGGY carbohydrate kinase domain-containing protein n=1 Tax=Selaginella moellendorffii TaxID=88036 RepID=UPI000D1CE64A|nr:FGGY carbohydrate kinase domain-containing protein [Selaginella moellendorffii]|eukprot:XP_024543764.1 FGGY carbohydrate kinase domain-containing protein [Selaginella moellendorffii]
MWKDGDFVEQSSTDIWHAVCAAVKAACENAAVSSSEVCGIGFAATCSLVAIGADDNPVSVSISGDARRNVIVWMDHRAVDQAKRINATGSPVLQFAGGGLSPEMEPPKLLWVKENLPESWAVAFRWMDLSDWLTYRATGDDTRSLCTTVCKWGYLGHAHLQHQSNSDTVAMEACGWDDVFWQEIGLSDLVEGQYTKIGRYVAFPGHPLGNGLSALAAKELGLLEGTPVGTALIDAHAGGVGVMEGVPSKDESITERMVLVCGTSTCHMAVSPEKVFIPGVWGPYWSAMVPGFWLTEGGQSATGALIDHLISSHPASSVLLERAKLQKTSIYELLNEILDTLASHPDVLFQGALTRNLHLLADFHGNRSPLANPDARGVISGLSLDDDPRSLALLYLAAIQGIAYGTRHIVEHCNSHGLQIKTLLACGGLSKNKVYLQQHADITGCSVILPREKESVLLGAAILGAVAAKKFHNVKEAMEALNAPGLVVEPSRHNTVQKYHDAKYKIFRSLYDQQVVYRQQLDTVLGC